MTKFLSNKALSLWLILLLIPCLAITILYFCVFFRRTMSNQNLISSTAPIIRRTVHQDTPILTKKKAQNTEESLLINSSIASGNVAAGDRLGLALNKSVKSIDDADATSEGNDIHLRQLSPDSEEDDTEQIVNSDEDNVEIEDDDDDDDENGTSMITNQEQPSPSSTATAITNTNHAVVVKKRNNNNNNNNNNGIDGKTKKQPTKPKSTSSAAGVVITTAADKGSDHHGSSIGKKRKEVVQEAAPTSSNQIGTKVNAEVEKNKQIKRIKKTASTPPELTDISQKCQHCIVNRQCAKSLLKTIEEILTGSFISRDDNNGQ